MDLDGENMEIGVSELRATTLMWRQRVCMQRVSSVIDLIAGTRDNDDLVAN